MLLQKWHTSKSSSDKDSYENKLGLLNIVSCLWPFMTLNDAIFQNVEDLISIDIIFLAWCFFIQSGLPYIEVLCKNRYVGRTFIQPSMRLRKLGVAKKFGALAENFRGQRIVLVDDSIVRGNTMAPIVKLLKSSGAAEVSLKQNKEAKILEQLAWYTFHIAVLVVNYDISNTVVLKMP